MIYYLKEKLVFLYYVFWRLFHIFSIQYKYPEKYIPKNTLYCYTSKIVRKHSDGVIGITVTPCYFYRMLLGNDICLYNGTDCLNDQCKTCGINDDIEKENENVQN